MSLYYQ